LTAEGDGLGETTCENKWAPENFQQSSLKQTITGLRLRATRTEEGIEVEAEGDLARIPDKLISMYTLPGTEDRVIHYSSFSLKATFPWALLLTRGMMIARQRFKKIETIGS
jgi:hypothetical protein